MTQWIPYGKTYREFYFDPNLGFKAGLQLCLKKGSYSFQTQETLLVGNINIFNSLSDLEATARWGRIVSHYRYLDIPTDKPE